MAKRNQIANKDKAIKRWLVPPGLSETLKEFEVTCDVLLEEADAKEKVQPLLICGPTGVGKSLFIDFPIGKFAKSFDSAFPVIPCNCAALPETLVESELFGYAKGAFSGASQDKAGAFELANDGILVLEEIGELPEWIQSKLLTVLETKRFYPIIVSILVFLEGSRQSVVCQSRRGDASGFNPCFPGRFPSILSAYFLSGLHFPVSILVFLEGSRQCLRRFQQVFH